MSEIAIRPLDAADRAAWEGLWAGYQAFYKVAIAAATTETTFRRLIDPATAVNGLVADHDGDIVGIVHFIFHASTWTEGDYCYLQDLFTAPQARGLGVGRRLIEAVVAAARAKGASRVHWLTHETNAQAMILYDQVAEKPGFLQYRIVF